MSDLTYTVEIKGLQDLDRLEGSIEKLTGALNASKGSGKGLEEMRKLLVGLKGKSSVFEEMRDSMKEMSTASKGMSRDMKDAIGGLSSVIKSEMATLRGVMNNAAAGMGAGFKEGAVKSLDEAEREITKKARSAAAKARAEMTKVYDTLVGGNGLSSLNVDQLGEVKMLKAAGASISRYHAEMLKNYETHLSQVRRVDNEFNKVAEQSAARGRQIFANFANSMGLDKTSVSKSAKESALVFKEAFAVEAASGRQTFANFEKSMGLDKASVAKSAKESAAVYSAAFAAEAQRTQRSAMPVQKMSKIDSSDAIYASSMGQMKAYYAEIEKGQAEAEKALKKSESAMLSASKSAGGLSSSMASLAISGNDVHSMARGLASGFNLLWLTWGNLAPLFAGAAISNGFVQTAKTGMEVAHTLSVIENVGGNTRDEMVQLREELVRLGNAGPFAPTAIAEAMQTLSLAGLKANEIIKTTQDVLNFSVAGTTSIQTAADTLVSVATAFDMGAQGFGRIADVISKAAAESKTSVESFANAMKLASVINAQYGASLEDTATAIATMSQLGIQGTSAGTALRNMYADLSGRSIKVTKILKEQGIQLRDTATGGFKPLMEVVGELSDKFATMTAIGQKNLIAALMSERGGKAIVEMLRLIRTEAKDTSKGFSNALAEVRSSIENSYGFAAENAAKLSQTTKSLFEQMGATLKTSMFEAYEGMEPTLALIARDLKATFGSEEFKKDLAAMTKFVAEFGRSLVSLGVFLSENAALVLGMAAAYKGFAIYAGFAAAAQAAQTAATVADTAANAANIASSAGRLTGIAALARFLPGVGLLVAGVAGAWALYDAYTRDATKSSLENARAYTDSVVKTLEDQTSKIAELNRLRREGLTLTEAQARLDGATKSQQALDPYAQAVNGAIKDELAARAELDKRRKAYAEYSAQDNKNRVTEQERVVAQLSANTRKLKNEELSAAEQVRAAVERGAAERKEAARLDKIDFEARANARQKFGDIDYSQAGTGKPFGGKPFEMADLDRTKDLQALQAYYDQRLSVQADAYSREKKIMDARRSGELISESQYMTDSYNLAQNYEDTQLALLEEGNTEYLKKYAERFAKMSEAMSSAKSQQTKDIYADAILKEQNELVIQTGKNAAQMVKIRAEAAERIELTYINLESAAGKLIKTDKEFWAARSRNTAAEKAAKDLEKAYSNINTSILSNDGALYAQAQAQMKVAVEVEEHNAKLKEQLRLHLEILEIEKLNLESKSMNPAVGPEELARTQALIEKMQSATEKMRETLKDSTQKGLEEGAEAGFRAFDEYKRQQLESLKGELGDIIVMGLTGKGKEAGKALRDMLQRELLTKPLTAFIKGALSMDGYSGSSTGSAQGGVMGMISGAFSKLTSIAGAFTGGSVASAGGVIAKIGETFGSEAIKSFAVGMKGSTLAPGLAGPTTAGASGAMGAGAIAGQVLNILGGVAGGISGGKLISGGYSAFGGSGNSTVNAGTAVGAAIGSFVPAIGTAIGSLLGGLVGGAVNRLFGRKLAGSGIQGDFGGDQGFAGSSYEFYKGGLFRSDKTKTTELDPETTRGFASTFKGLQLGTAAMAATLGLGTESIKNFTTSIKIDLKDLSEEEASKKISEEFDKIAESLAQTALAGTGYITSMETAVETLTRLSQGLVGVNGVFELLGIKLYENTLAGAGMAQVLIAASGGLEQFTSATQTYYDSFYTEQERMLKERDLQMKSLQESGLYIDPAEGNAAKEAFRKTVTEALNSGQVELAAKLLGMAGKFAEVADYAQQVTDQLSGMSKTWKELGEGMTMLSGIGEEVKSVLVSVSGSFDTFSSNAKSFYQSFYTQEERMQAQRVANMAALSELGLYIDPYGGQAAKDLFRATVNEAMESGQTALAAKLLGMAASFGQTADHIIGQVGNVWEKIIQGVEELGQTAADFMVSADSARTAAGDLLDRIGSALGGSGNTYAAKREQRLWAAMAEADYERQIELAGQLTDIVLSRYETEKANAESLLDFGKSLRSYVDGLKLGSLSPMTTAEKLAEAGRQYQATLKAAQGGDVTAQGNLQGISSSYLELAREYYASSGDYANIFNSVTGALDSLGLKSQTEAQQQLEVSSKSLEELKALQAVVESAYAKADADYETQKTILQEQVNQLLRTASGIEAVRDILSNLPAELAGQINAGGVQNSGRYSTLAQSYVSLLGGKGGSSTDVNYVAGSMANLDKAAWDRELSNAMGLLTDSSARAQMQAIFDAVARIKGIDGSHRDGLGYVPFDNYIAQLHQGERVLTAGENRAYSATNWYGSSEESYGQSFSILTAAVQDVWEEIYLMRLENQQNAKIGVEALIGTSQKNAEDIVEGVSSAVQGKDWEQGQKSKAGYN